MYGAIIGDIVGSRFEFNNINTKKFEFWGEGCEFTDDTVMTIAVAESLLCTRNPDELGNVLKDIMRDYGHGYPNVGYGGMFRQWLMSADPQPYNSFGNGSAMRVSPCGYVAESLEEALALAKASAEISHNPPEGIKGAEAVVVAIYMARTGATKKEIKTYIEDNYYKLNFTLRDVRQEYHFSEACQDTVPQAIKCFLEAESFEDSIRNAISIGGDSDTIACIAGSIAEAYYGTPNEMIQKAKTYLPKCFVDIIEKFYVKIEKNKFVSDIACVRIERQVLLAVEQYNAKTDKEIIDMEKIHIGWFYTPGEGDAWGCFQCGDEWYAYEVLVERGIDDGRGVMGPYDEDGVRKVLLTMLLKTDTYWNELTDKEKNLYFNSSYIGDFRNDHCKTCKNRNCDNVYITTTVSLK